MARPIRIQYPGAVYHVMARGNQGGEVFRDAPDRRTFLGSLGEACAKTGWRVHACVLMSNHYHLLVETPEPNLVEGMKWLQGTYTQRFNQWKPLRRGWYVGGKGFLEKLVGDVEPALAGRRRESFSGGAKATHDGAAAERALARGLKVLGLSGEALARLPKGAAEKVALAEWLRQRTTVPLRWVSERLGMGHYTRVTQAVSRMRRRPGRKLEKLRRQLAQPALKAK